MTQKKPKGYDVSKQEVTQIYPREKSGISSNVDIVIVPGLSADPVECWRSRNKDSDFNWTTHKDGLQNEFREARLLLYKYESAYHGGFKVKQQSLTNLANALLSGLQSKREV